MSERSNRTEQPTPRRLERARKDGNFPASKDFVAGVTLLVAVWLLDSYAEDLLVSAKQLFIQLLARPMTVGTPHGVLAQLLSVLRSYFLFPLLCGLCISLATLGAHLGTTQLSMSWSKLRPDISRLNSLPRISQMPAQNLRSAVMAIVLILGSGYAFWYLTGRHWEETVRMTRMGLAQETVTAGTIVMRLLWNGSVLLFLLGCFDLFRQRKRWWAQLRMTKQEVREEHKEMEGNPMIRMRIRRLQRELSRHKMMQEVPTATAVVVNPTHYAVALRYRIEGATAPKVVAKGQNWQALRIREIAVRHEVPIIENPPLARALYASAEIGQEIPPELYQAVAEVLAYIFRLLNGQLPGKESVR
jgi:flagellar biosynthesis protein FlhB